MIQKNFEQALQKGEVGEKIIKELLEKKGWIVYQPTTKNKAHAFDILSIKDKKEAMALDIKAKSRMNIMNATGINQNHFEDYLYYSKTHNTEFWLIFVDEGLREVYGNTLSNLEKPTIVNGRSFPRLMTTKKGEVIRLWSLESMKPISKLTNEQVEELKKYNQRNYEYKII